MAKNPKFDKVDGDLASMMANIQALDSLSLAGRELTRVHSLFSRLSLDETREMAVDMTIEALGHLCDEITQKINEYGEKLSVKTPEEKKPEEGKEPSFEEFISKIYGHD